ncbi:hypothetical protein EON66_10300 [archaeon]|nr:MAG: hypothetical protein EON66_10300 [archaeon]
MHPFLSYCAGGACSCLQRDRALACHNAELNDMMTSMKQVQRTVTDYHNRLFRAFGELAAPAAAPAVYAPTYSGM